LLGEKPKVIIGNDDAGDNCDFYDHSFTIWATDEEIQNGRSIDNEQSSENSNDQESATDETDESEETSGSENQENNNNDNEEQQEETQQTSGLSDNDIGVEINDVEENFPSDEFTGLSELEFSLDVDADVERNGFQNYIYYSEVFLSPSEGDGSGGRVSGKNYDFESYQPRERSSNPVLVLEYPQIDGLSDGYKAQRPDFEPGKTYDLKLHLFVQHETEEGGIVDSDYYQLDKSLTYTGENYMYPEEGKEYSSLDQEDVNGKECDENSIYRTESYEGNNYICDCEDGSCSWITTKNEQRESNTEVNENEEESESMCSGGFDAWLPESEVSDYPVEIRGCTTDDLEQINVMMGYDDGVTSYSTLSIKPSGVNCNGGTCELTNVKYNEHDDKDYGFTMEITDGKNFADLNKPVKVDTDVIALKETYPGGRAGDTDSQWLEEACSGSTYSCVDSEQPYKADLVATVGLKTDYSPGTTITLTEGQTVRFPEGCEYQATYVYQNQPKLKIWHSGTSTGETSIGDTENFETQEGTEIEVNSWNPDEVSLSATCSEWDTENEEDSEEGGSYQEIDTDITWINYCQNQDSGDLTKTENIVSCLSSCYGESKDSSAEGSDDLTCGEVVKSYCDSANAEYNEEGDTARCS
jgi:hypothetical protein